MRTLRPAIGGLTVATAALSLALLSPTLAQSPDASVAPSMVAPMSPSISIDPCASPLLPVLSPEPITSMAPMASMAPVATVAPVMSPAASMVPMPSSVPTFDPCASAAPSLLPIGSPAASMLPMPSAAPAG